MSVQIEIKTFIELREKKKCFKHENNCQCLFFLKICEKEKKNLNFMIWNDLRYETILLEVSYRILKENSGKWSAELHTEPFWSCFILKIVGELWVYNFLRNSNFSGALLMEIWIEIEFRCSERKFQFHPTRLCRLEFFKAFVC